MVAQQILVLFVWVRVLAGQQSAVGWQRFFYLFFGEILVNVPKNFLPLPTQKNQPLKYELSYC